MIVQVPLWFAWLMLLLYALCVVVELICLAYFDYSKPVTKKRSADVFALVFCVTFLVCWVLLIRGVG